MRHGDKINNLGRTASHRKAMLKNMACSLIQHKSINTTVAKAKALRKLVEPLITKSKTDSQHNRRVVFSYLQDKNSVKELFGTVAEKVGERPGGYTRILKIGLRSGDNAEMAMIELIDFNEYYTPKTKNATAGKKRSRRGTGKSVAQPAEEFTAITEEKVIDVVEEIEIIETTSDAEKIIEPTSGAEEIIDSTSDAEEIKE